MDKIRNKTFNQSGIRTTIPTFIIPKNRLSISFEKLNRRKINTIIDQCIVNHNYLDNFTVISKVISA